jgi:hypothetical protein
MTGESVALPKRVAREQAAFAAARHRQSGHKTEVHRRLLSAEA